MRQNRVKEKLDSGQLANAVFGYTENADLIEFLGQLGFDAAWIECEHGPVTWQHLGDLSRACDLWGMTSLVRVPANEPWVITRTLDRGANGIVVPHVNTKEEAQRVVESAKFGPIGRRGMYSGRRALGVENYFETANEETLVVVLIEEVRALENLAEILTVDHIDVFFLAPSDLAQTMGLTGQANHPRVLAAVDAAIAQIVAAGRTAGTLVRDDTLDRYLNLGARFFMIPWDAWVASGSRLFLSRLSAHSKVVSAPKPKTATG